MFVLSNGDNNELGQNEEAKKQNAVHVYSKCAEFCYSNIPPIKCSFHVLVFEHLPDNY